MSALDLLHDWQESLKRALAENFKDMNLENDALLEAVGIQAQTGLQASLGAHSNYQGCCS